MLLRAAEKIPQLAPYLSSCWIFESDFGHPISMSRVITPNGRLKIVLPFDNDLFAVSSILQQRHMQGKIQFIGNADQPYIISTEARCSGTLILELTPQGASRLAPFNINEITNHIVLFTDVYGSAGKRLEQELLEINDPIEKAFRLQTFLVGFLNCAPSQMNIIDYSVNAILQTQGCLKIKTLEKKTGYTKRYLDMLFKKHIGISPKTLCSITRFQYFHSLWAKNPSPGFYGNEIYSFYHDQSHFIREFKRFSGYTPEQYAVTDNELGRIFYRD
jgi:AraC-like DNA-binding protein